MEVKNCLKIASVVVFVAVAGGAFAQGGGNAGVMVRELEYVPPPPLGTPCPTHEPGVQTDGCTNPDPRDALKTFKINVPVDWDVRLNDGANAIFMEPKQKAVATPENPVVADPNISVKATKNPIPVDESGLDEFAEEIEAGLNRTEQGIENPQGRLFKVFNKSFVSLPFGHRAYLYYVGGNLNGVAVRQAVLVASTQNIRYRVQLTDTEQNFDASLEKYFPVMTSLQLSGAPMQRPSTFLAVLPWVLGFGTVFGFFVVLKAVRVRNTRRLIEEVESAQDTKTSSQEKSRTPSNNEYPDDDY